MSDGQHAPTVSYKNALPLPGVLSIHAATVSDVYRETAPVLRDKARMSILGDHTSEDTSCSVCLSSSCLMARFCAMVVSSFNWLLNLKVK